MSVAFYYSQPAFSSYDYDQTSPIPAYTQGMQHSSIHSPVSSSQVSGASSLSDGLYFKTGQCAYGSTSFNQSNNWVRTVHMPPPADQHYHPSTLAPSYSHLHTHHHPGSYSETTIGLPDPHAHEGGPPDGDRSDYYLLSYREYLDLPWDTAGLHEMSPRYKTKTAVDIEKINNVSSFPFHSMGMPIEYGSGMENHHPLANQRGKQVRGDPEPVSQQANAPWPPPPVPSHVPTQRELQNKDLGPGVRQEPDLTPGVFLEFRLW